MKNFINIVLILGGITNGYAQNSTLTTESYTNQLYIENNNASTFRDVFEHDIKLEYRSVRFMGENGYMYTTIPHGSEYYLNFSAKISNTGNNLELAQLQVQTSDGSFSVLSDAIEIQPNEAALFTIDAESSWIAIPWGTTLTFTALSNNILDNTQDDTQTFQYGASPADAPFFSADFYNGLSSSMTGQYTGNSSNSNEQGIGILFESLGSHPFNLSHIDLGIADIPQNEQDEYIGNLVYGKVWHYSFDELTLLGQTESKVITAEDFGKTIWLEAQNSCIITPSQGILLVAACFHSDARVPIALAGDALYQQVSVFNDNVFNWTQPIFESLNTHTNVPVIRPFFACPLGLSENNSLFQTTIFPNPTENTTSIALDLIVGQNMIITIQDLSGKTIKKLNLGYLTPGSQNIALNLSELASGVYMLTLINDSHSETHKLVIE